MRVATIEPDMWLAGPESNGHQEFALSWKRATERSVSRSHTSGQSRRTRAIRSTSDRLPIRTASTAISSLGRSVSPR